MLVSRVTWRKLFSGMLTKTLFTLPEQSSAPRTVIYYNIININIFIYVCMYVWMDVKTFIMQ